MTEHQIWVGRTIAGTSIVPVCVLVIALSVQTFGQHWYTPIPIVVIPSVLYYCVFSALKDEEKIVAERRRHRYARKTIAATNDKVPSPDESRLLIAPAAPLMGRELAQLYPDQVDEIVERVTQAVVAALRAQPE